MIAFLISLSFFSELVRAADPVVLPAVVNRADPSALLHEGGSAPSQRGETGGTGGSSGGIDRGLSQQLLVPVSSPGAAGGYTVFRGMGKSVEETGTQVFGVPTNAPQGGGFDLSVFPSFLWNDFRYYTGPTPQSGDPKTSAGTLVLVPWSERMLEGGATEPRLLRAKALYSTLGQWQTAAGLANRGQSAVMAGYSDGLTRGPSGSLSVRRELGARSEARVHFLGTSVEQRIKGPAQYPTPHATQKTQRLIPVVQVTTQFGEQWSSRSVIYTDWGKINYDNPESGWQDRSQSTQLGVDQRLSSQVWSVGLGARRLTYENRVTVLDPEWQLQASAQRKLIFNESVWIEPSVQGISVSGMGLFPGAGVGGVWKISERSQAQLRTAYTSRIPSLINREYRDSFFLPNKNLKPERQWSLSSGYRWSSDKWSIEGTGLLQWSRDAQVLVGGGAKPMQVINAGNAKLLSFSPKISWEPLVWLTLSQSILWNESFVSQLGHAFPYLAPWGALSTVTLQDPSAVRRWNIDGTLRLSSTRVVNAGQTLGGYAVLDVGSSVRLGAFDVGLRVENVLDRQDIEWNAGYPLAGRTWILQASLVEDWL